MAKISLLMNCYNGEKYLKAALDSVYAQTFSDWEIIFVDNCSSDGSKEIALSYDERLKYYKTPHFMSLCEARVWAREFIVGEYFCILDTDDILMPTKFEKQVKVLDENPHIGFTYHNCIFFKDSGEEMLQHKQIMPSGKIFSYLVEGYFFAIMTLMVRKSVMDKHNLYFSPLYNLCSDMEFFSKLAYFTEALYIDEVLAKYRYGHGNSTEKNLESFPREHLILLEEFTNMIPNFRETYAKELIAREANINNAFGLSAWQRGDLKEARKFLAKASSGAKKYFINYLLSFFLSYQKYKRLKNKMGKI